MIAIVLLAGGMGLTANMLRPDKIPLIRKPLRETRRYTSADDLLTETPKANSEQSASKTEVIAQAPARDLTPEVVSKAIPDVRPNATTISQKALRTKQQIPTQAKSVVTILSEKPDKKPQALFTTLEDAKALYDKNAALFVDGRLPIDYEAEHISGAVNLFCEKANELHEKVLGNVPKDKVIVTYCSDPECTESMKLADALVAKGFTKVVILLEGLPGWKDAGYPTAKKETE